MSEHEAVTHEVEDDDEVDSKLNYKPPPQKSMQEIQEMDKDDESLAKYKKSLLGEGPVVADPSVPNVTVTRLTLVCETAPAPITMDLTQDLDKLKKTTFVLKEGCEYRVKISFKVCKEIVSGLKYVQHTYRTGVKAPERKAIMLSDVPSAEAFIDSTDIAVVGFFTDLEEPEIEYFDTLVKNHPEWDYGTSTSPEVLKRYKIKSNTITIFRKADNWRDDLVVKENEDINTAKLYRFLTINELRLVTDYNPMTAIGLIACKVQVHLLFFTESDVVQNEADILKELREATNDLRGKVLFVKLNVGKKYTGKIAGFLKLKKSDLPVLSIYHTEDNKKLIMPPGEITAEKVKEFCLKFLSGDYKEEELESHRKKIEL